MECVLLNSFAETLGVEVYIEDVELISIEKLLEILKEYCGDVEIVEQNNEMIIIAFNDYSVESENEDEKLKMGISIKKVMPNMEKLEKAFNQSWIYPVTKTRVKRADSTLILAEINGQAMKYFDRLKIFQRALYAVLNNVKPVAIYWPLTQQIIDGDLYFNNNPKNKYYDILMGAVNIRIFKLHGVENELLIDTLGLGALGLIDIQCRFKNIEPQVVANVLYNYAYYIYENGDVIEDGTIIRGISPGNRWIGNRGVSILEPKRSVLNIIEVKE